MAAIAEDALHTRTGRKRWAGIGVVVTAERTGDSEPGSLFEVANTAKTYMQFRT